MVQFNFPSLTNMSDITSETSTDVLAELVNSQNRLLKELEYGMYNLDDDNFNETEWDNITDPIYARIEDNEENIAELSLTADTFSVMVSGISDDDGLVTAASIVAAVNEAGSTVKINADHIEFTGYTTFLTADDVGSSGSTTISGDRITTGRIDADLITTGELSANRISGGTINASDIYGVNIAGVAISGSTFESVSDDPQNPTEMLLNAATLIIENSVTSDSGSISLGETGQFIIFSDDELLLAADNDVVISTYDDFLVSSDNLDLTSTAIEFNVIARFFDNVTFGNSSNDITVYFYGDVNFSNATVTGLP